MFNNSVDYIEELAPAGGEINRLFELMPELFAAVKSGPAPGGDAYRQSRVDSLVWAYRDIGYLHANLNPLGESYAKDFTRLPEYRDRTYHALTLEEFGLSASDLDREFFGGAHIGGTMRLRDLILRLRETYCAFVGVEFLHIQNKDIREWLIARMESCRNVTKFTREQKRIILADLVKTEEMELMLHKTFLGQTRFSIQGAEAVIPALHFLVDTAHRFGVEEIVLGTSHRGRLSVLNTILDKSPEEIFHLFEANYVPGYADGSGDVRYHIGYCTRHRNEDGTGVNITLLPNSSQLESVDAVVEGDARGLQDLRGDAERARIMPVLIHGDASFSGQGVVAETLNLSQLKGYTTGGTIHIVINNQIGFTTASPREHSGLNPTDIAKMLPVPVFHANGDEPEAVLHAVILAMEYRQAFHRDVVVDIVCYRRYGHNEGDEPSYTQPFMYALIKDHPGVVTLFEKKCLDDGTITDKETGALRAEYRESLASALARERGTRPPQARAAQLNGGTEKTAGTAVDGETLLSIAEKISAVPASFNIHPRLKKIIESNRERLAKERLAGWAVAESLAFGTLLAEGITVRLSGQDSERGTFSQRHLAWWEAEGDGCCSYVPLNNIREGQAKLDACNSPLSEFSVLAFEYGYAIARRDALVIWEAQYGDFVNGAQIIIDNYLVSSRSKWDIENGLVMLLPHGYEGMGPEHSSGHLERFLSLCAENNIRVCYPTTPAQYFHLLRMQDKLKPRTPLVIMTPKSLLRHPRVVSPLEELAGGGFRRVIGDPSEKTARRVVFCTGKIYYDITGDTGDRERESVAIVRIEQLHPFPGEEIAAVLEEHGGSELVWVQEEPRNRGAWQYVRDQFDLAFPGLRLDYIGRPASASPATGSLAVHNEEQKDIVARALANPEKRQVSA